MPTLAAEADIVVLGTLGTSASTKDSRLAVEHHTQFTVQETWKGKSPISLVVRWNETTAVQKFQSLGSYLLFLKDEGPYGIWRIKDPAAFAVSVTFEYYADVVSVNDARTLLQGK